MDQEDRDELDTIDKKTPEDLRREGEQKSAEHEFDMRVEGKQIVGEHQYDKDHEVAPVISPPDYDKDKEETDES